MKILKSLLMAAIAIAITSCNNQQGGTRTFYASQCGVPLNSDVYKGGGTDATDKLQAILDKAPELGRLELVLDGAALISRSLKIHNNTTIICPDKSCGLFLADSSNCALLTNADKDTKVIRNRNISLIGGVYNQNSPGQKHHVVYKSTDGDTVEGWVFVMDFAGVENVLMRDITLANQRTFALLMTNWKHVTMENIHVDRRIRMNGENQDGLHFFGPGRFLTLRNIYGNSGDDFIALAPDEADKVSTIEDVLIDGVHLEEADQGIRLLCRENGRLDRVIIRNVTGTYNSYGFIINPWFQSPNGGNYGNIVFENIDLRPCPTTYTYAFPFLFKVGGHVESLTLKNIYQHKADYNHRLVLVDDRYGSEKEAPQVTTVDRLIIDGLYIDEDNADALPDTYINVRGKVGVLSVSNVIQRCAPGLPKVGSLIQRNGGMVDDLLLNNISATDVKQIVK